MMRPIVALVARALPFALASSLPITIPLGLDLYLPVPDSNLLTVDRIALGERLFEDRRLSSDGSISCRSCHDPRHGFGGSTPVAVGVFGRRGARNVPALINRGYGRAFFWDGRIASLEEQVLMPIVNPEEMDLSVAEASARVGLSVDDLSRALASYVRTILSGNSRYDRFLHGDPTSLTSEAQAGLQVFRRSGCQACHVPPTFTDERFHNTGVAWRPAEQRFQDEGRFLVTGRRGDRGAFKTPTLRDVAGTAPYMHDGSLNTLEAVIDFYDQGGRPNQNLDVEIRPLHLSPADKHALVAFLHSLSGTIQAGRSR
ncbi:MAG TPA: cytochrome c peroxidase [Vicinamibacterales bacterium]|jgi:cytochrome c peroxidase|nr:cytochrome c peroxidase [Vicinamibacterales bacterium]